MMVKTNWLWDTQLQETDVRQILSNPNNPRFLIYASKIFSRVQDPREVFQFIDHKTFCRKWPLIKKRLKKDVWMRDKVNFWQSVYERAYLKLKMQEGFQLRQTNEREVSAHREDVARQIKDLRLSLGLTQREFAKRLGVIQQFVSRIENGHENVTVDTMNKIADIFGKRLRIRFE